MIVLLCSELEKKGLDLGELSKRLTAQNPGLQVRLGKGPCGTAHEWLEDGLDEGVILGLCSLPESQEEVLAHARKKGAPRGGVEMLALGLVAGNGDGLDRTGSWLQSAISKLETAISGGPQNDKMLLSWDGPVSRRSLFTLPPVRYRTIPSVQPDLCAAAQGCRICAQLCPHDALSAEDGGSMMLQKEACTGCGACVSTCPRGAFQFPGNDLDQLHNQVRTFLSPGGPNRGILFHCHNSASILGDIQGWGNGNWLPVEIPCLGMVSPGWVFQCIQAGASSVALLPCPVEECRFGKRDLLGERLEYGSDVLNALGDEERRVHMMSAGDVLPDLGELSPLIAEIEDLERSSLSPRNGADSLVQLFSEKTMSAPEPITHPGSFLGTVSLKEGCTLCGSCATACPAGALSIQEDKVISLKFEPASCVGCSGCVPVCPENVIEVEKKTDFQSLLRGRSALFEDDSPRCVKCGARIAPQAMLDRIGSVLGSDNPVLTTLKNYCVDCRKTIS